MNNEILKGFGASRGRATGKVCILADSEEIYKVKEGDIIVTKMTTPDMVPAMRRAVGIVTDRGGITSHAAVIARELRIPCVVGTGDATKVLKEGQEVLVNGDTGAVREA